jgi:Ca2+-binding RTX toxin-like protein
MVGCEAVSMLQSLECRTMLSVSLKGDVLVVRGDVCYDNEIEVALIGALDASYGYADVNGKRFPMHAPDLPDKVVIYGSDGNDKITFTTSLMWPTTIIRGGQGRDDIHVNGPRADVKGGGGDDVIRSSVWLQDRPRNTRGSTLAGGSGDDTIVASNGDDSIVGGQGADLLSGGRDRRHDRRRFGA